MFKLSIPGSNVVFFCAVFICYMLYTVSDTKKRCFSLKERSKPTDNPATQPDVCLCNGGNPGAGWLPDKLMKMGFTVADRKISKQPVRGETGC